MRRTVLAGLALISLAACRDAKKPAAAAARPPAMKSYAASPKVKKTTKPKGKKASTLARKPARAAPHDTAETRNPLLNH